MTGKFVRISKLSSSIATNVDDQSLTLGQPRKHTAYITIGNRFPKAFVDDVADTVGSMTVVCKSAVFESAGYTVIVPQILASQVETQIQRIVFVPFPIMAVVERAAQIDMTVFQFGEELRHDEEERVTAHLGT